MVAPWKVSFDTTIQSALENASIKFTPQEVVNRSLLEPEIAKSLQTSADAKYGKGCISIIRVVVGRIEYEKSYINAINDKNEAEQEAENSLLPALIGV